MLIYEENSNFVISGKNMFLAAYFFTLKASHLSYLPLPKLLSQNLFIPHNKIISLFWFKVKGN